MMTEDDEDEHLRRRRRCRRSTGLPISSQQVVIGTPDSISVGRFVFGSLLQQPKLESLLLIHSS
jgi:hypothetical protein